MYQILIKHQTAPHYKWYMYTEPGSADEKIWKTKSWAKLSSKYLNLLGTYPAERLTVVDTKDVHFELSTDPTLYLDIKRANVENDGTIFHIDTEISLETGVVYGFDEFALQDIITELEDAGLQNIEITPWRGVNAVNPTGTPLVGRYTLPRGFLKIIDQKTQFADYRSNEFTIVL